MFQVAQFGVLAGNLSQLVALLASAEYEQPKRKREDNSGPLPQFSPLFANRLSSELTVNPWAGHHSLVGLPDGVFSCHWPTNSPTCDGYRHRE